MNYQLDEIDKKILDFLVENTRMPFTEIAKQMDVSAGTIHVRVKKMEDAGIILGSSLNIDYGKLDYHFTAFIGILLTKSNRTQEVLTELASIPNVVEASVISGKYNIFCKVRAKNAEDAKRIIYQIDDIQDVMRTESMISMEEFLSDKNRLINIDLNLSELNRITIATSFNKFILSFDFIKFDTAQNSIDKRANSELFIEFKKNNT